MLRSLLSDNRKKFHSRILTDLLFLDTDEIPSNADKKSEISISIAKSIIGQIGSPSIKKKLKGQVAGAEFENICAEYLQETIKHLSHLHSGRFNVTKGGKIFQFQQYAHLAELEKIAKTNNEIAIAIGSDYLIKPDIIISRFPETDDKINAKTTIVNNDVAKLTAIRKVNFDFDILHASISCKWTLRSDRAQNARSEALNLMRNRKGKLPHIVAITGEPMPSRIASLALGTGDIDCVYHFALYELEKALKNGEKEDSFELFKAMVDGKRLKDISDLPLDLMV